MAGENQNAPTGSGQQEQGQGGKGSSGRSGTAAMKRGAQEPSRAMSRPSSREWSGFPTTLLGGSPFTIMRRMFDDMDRLFGESLTWPLGETRSIGAGRPWSPEVEVFEREGQLVVRADLPGLRNEDLRVEVTEAGLVLEGERKEEREGEERGFYRSERVYGAFRREIPLPQDVDVERAEAKFENGVLEVTLPVDEQRRKGRRIEVKGGGSAPSVH